MLEVNRRERQAGSSLGLSAPQLESCHLDGPHSADFDDDKVSLH